MSHQTGITANEALRKFFSTIRDEKIRVFKVSIENEALVLSGHKKVVGSWTQDFDKYVPDMIEDAQPCYILYRFDTKNETGGYDWLLIFWSPDESPVRQKMLYASTKSTLKQDFGSGQIKEEIHATVPTDATLHGFEIHKRAVKAPAPLTSAEEERKEQAKYDLPSQCEISVTTRTQTLSGVAFPLLSDAESSVHKLIKRKYNYVQFRIDLQEETINLVQSGEVTLKQLPSMIPTDGARYHLFNFRHQHEGNMIDSIVFIYSMPGYSLPIKERMLYSSCKGPLLENLQQLGLTIDKKLEIDSGSELTEDFLLEELHPSKQAVADRPKFDKPKGPPNRGAKRITKPVAPAQS
uniref:Twinfilin n=2 Tax=Cacopsylla melanoneura TaxID=428564 RepID=A0A8D8VYF0_9HEMI